MEAFKTSSTLLLVLLVFVATLCSSNVAAEEQDLCRYFKNNTKVRDPDSCDRYITCIEHKSYYTTCPSSTPFYDKDTEKCVKTLTNDDVFCAISCVDSVGHFIEDPKSCYGYYYCHNEELATPGTCPDAQHFNATLEACIYKHESECRATQFDFCAIVKSGTKWRDDTACHKYYSCTKGVIKENTCSKKYYDPLKGECVDKATVDCVEHPLPKEVCGTAKKPKVNVFVADDATCRGYFFCAKQEDGSPDANPYWGQCPPDTFFNKADEACTDPMLVKCDWDRCDGRTKQFVTAKNKGCRHYHRCVDGIVAETLTCGNLFFDEKQGVCTTEIIKEAACNS